MASKVEIEKFRDTSVELKLVAYALRKDHKICDWMNRDLFSIKAYKLFYDIVSSHKTTLPKDILKDVLSERLKKPGLVNPYLIKVYKVDVDSISQRNVKSFINKLKKISFLRLSVEAIEDMVSKVGDADVDAIRKSAKKISMLGIDRKKAYSGDYLKDVEERESILEARRKQKGMIGVPTGIRRFDTATGGLMNGELAIIAGESGIGKSIALENFGISAWMNQMNVFYVSIEMTKHQVQFRMDSRLTRMYYRKFRLGDISDEDLSKWRKEMERLRVTMDNFFEVVSLPRGCTALEIEAEAERVQDIHGQELDLIIVDYLNIMNPNTSVKGTSSRDWQAQATIASELKELAISFRDEGIAVWTGNQVTDAGEGQKVLKKKHIKYGRGIVEVANIVLGLIQTQDDELEDIMRLHAIKMRDVEKIEPIILRPNFDIMVLNDELRSRGHGSVSRWRSSS